MDKEYVYKDQYFGVSKEGLHLMRSGYNYDTIPLSEIKTVQVKRGKTINNWALLLAFGFILIGVAAFLTINITHNDARHNFSIEEIAGIVVFTVIGGFTIWKSIQTEEVLDFQTLKKSYRYSIKEISRRR